MSRDVTQSESRPVADGRRVTERHLKDVRLGERARVLTAEAREARESLEPPSLPATDRCTLECAHDGVDPIVSLYVSAWTGDRQVSFTDEEFELPYQATNDWLIMYARCYGADLDADSMVREAAEVLLRIHDTVDTA